MDKRLINELEEREKNHYWHKTKRKIIKNVLIKADSPKKTTRPKTLLDIGCGAGINLSYFRHSFHCVGIEPDPTLAKQARYNSQTTIYQHSLPLDIPSLHNKFDCILLLDVLEHINNDLEALKSIVPLLSKEGIIIINVPALPILWSTHDRITQHKRRYTQQSLQRLINKAGLNTLNNNYWNSLAVPLIYLQRCIYYRHTPTNQYKLQTTLPKTRNSLYHRLLLMEYYITKPFKIPFGLSLLAVVNKKLHVENLTEK